jgi:hypothetical protein
MRTQESEERMLNSLDRYQYSLREDIHDFCREAWKHCSPEMRERYPQYEIPYRNLVAFVPEMNSGDEDMPVISVLKVLDALVDIKECYDEYSFADDEGAAEVLEQASYAAGMLGGDVFEGDLEFFLRRCSNYRNDEDLPAPLALLKLHEEGNDTDLITFLNRKLDRSARQIVEMPLDQTKVYDVIDYAPSPWFMDDDGMDLDIVILGTMYHYFASLLRYLEPESGNA